MIEEDFHAENLKENGKEYDPAKEEAHQRYRSGEADSHNVYEDAESFRYLANEK